MPLRWQTGDTAVGVSPSIAFDSHHLRAPRGRRSTAPGPQRSRKDQDSATGREAEAGPAGDRKQSGRPADAPLRWRVGDQCLVPPAHRLQPLSPLGLWGRSGEAHSPHSSIAAERTRTQRQAGERQRGQRVKERAGGPCGHVAL
ncbi:hypothetical protein NDU88_005678 [Pleurodeles waltl]|uniref:Uncharacterized protein n=1 Tax=Pleurodeles waltl TaxID=8319 RepID=A0AAV7QLP9_PLEWA|nr:hypothetical protein NDU88_005678 [Pleurodeles waltl]